MKSKYLVVVIGTLGMAGLQSHAAPPRLPIPSPQQKVDYEVTLPGDAKPLETLYGTMTGAAIRFDAWPNTNGTVNFGLNWSSIRAGSHVYISASEVDNAGNRFNGAAAIAVQNVVVKEGRVEFRMVVNWASPIRISTDILTINP
ncbi:hypothetical protein OV208_08905 [Corallococcus sp. bb12-1]|uniref:hypothetical protein n=1 Tax=Corallococcus sp. bb12-1 TaxID=2996784 RepID=UPI00226F393E|nr:hypothetical protein [Corallococcus sp. bb12-1]MCY1041432.1 hypothetical protein [Corallococcus sp. bb12-1]